jgi:hypothetical protein
MADPSGRPRVSGLRSRPSGWPGATGLLKKAGGAVLVLAGQFVVGKDLFRPRQPLEPLTGPLFVLDLVVGNLFFGVGLWLLRRRRCYPTRVGVREGTDPLWRAEPSQNTTEDDRE